MSKDEKIMLCKGRINKLSINPVQNANIIRKAKRKLRKLQSQ